jgi:drug/metabolite transporter (DMT)-like permease
MSLAAFCVLAWATSFVLIGYGLQHFDPLALGFARFSFAAFAGIVYLFIKRPALPSLQDFGKLAFCGAFGISLYAICLNYAQLTLPAGLASFITGINPLITMLLATFILHEKVGKYLVLGALLSFFGVFLISASRGGFSSIDVNVLLVLLAATFGAIVVIVQKPMLATMQPLELTSWVLIFGALCLTPFSGDAITQFMKAPITHQLNVVYIGLIPGFFAYGAFVGYIKQVGAAKASTIIFAVPFFAALFGYLLLGQTMTWLGFLGGVVALAGVALAKMKG